MKYELNGNKIAVNEKEIIFENKISSEYILELNGLLIILLLPTRNDILMDNVYAISEEGEISWQIESRNHPPDVGHTYLYIRVIPPEHAGTSVAQIGATDFGGWACHVDVNTGKILSTRFLK